MLVHTHLVGTDTNWYVLNIGYRNLVEYDFFLTKVCS